VSDEQTVVVPVSLLAKCKVMLEQATHPNLPWVEVAKVQQELQALVMSAQVPTPEAPISADGRYMTTEDIEAAG